MNEIERLQDNLLLIRRSAGWTADDLGERIGVTRQTINNLEAHRNKLSKTQYIAIRAVLDAEIAESPKDTEMIKYLLDVFVDNPEMYKKEERDLLLAKANMLAPSILAGTSKRKDVSDEFVKLAAAVGVVTIAGLAAIPAIPGITGAAGVLGAWLLKTHKKKK